MNAPAPEPHLAVTLPTTGIAKLSTADLKCWRDFCRGDLI